MSDINLKVPAVAIREIRLNTITGFQGTAKELVDYGRCGQIKDKSRSFSQCLGCSTSNAACMVTLIQDAVVISHGPVGCSSCLHDYAFTYRVNARQRGILNPTQRKIYSTNLDERDTIYGGTEQLEKTIREAYQRSHPNAIFIITTCASGIIGDDVEGTANDAAEELGIPVVAIFCEGFRSKVWTSGFDAGYHGIARRIIAPPEKRQANLVNIINFWGSDVFSQWFDRLGLKANFITPYATVDQLRHASEAALSVQICPTLGSYMGAVLEKEFGVREVRSSPPYGIAQTDRWFREIGEILGKQEEVETFLAAQKREFLPQIEALRTRLKGKTAYVTAGAAHGHSLLEVLGELGMRATGAAIFHHDVVYDNESEESDTLAHAVKDYGDVPNYNVCNKQEFELVNMLNRSKPDILLARHGGMTLWGAKLGVPSLLVGDEHYSMGYEGLINYGERILETIENDEFVKNLEKHAINPYTKWWLAQPTFTFLGGEEIHVGNH